MSFSDLFGSEFKIRNKGHFSAIVRVAIADGVLNTDEAQFLDKLKIRLEISDEEYLEILASPTKYPINAPVMHIQRLDRLYDLARMVYADHIIGPNQKVLLSKFALALGFNPGDIVYIVDKALSLIILEVDLDTFLHEMQNMNK